VTNRRYLDELCDRFALPGDVGRRGLLDTTPSRQTSCSP
jgi:hypothetical protein